MCGLCGTADHLLLVHEAGAILDEMLAGIVEPLSKAVDLNTKRGFDRAVALLAAKLHRVSGPADAKAVRAAVAALDIDWQNSTKQQRSRAVNDAVIAAGKMLAIVPAQIRAPFGDVADELVRATRRDVKAQQGLSIAASFNALDKRIISHVVGSQGNFVRDEYGRRVETFGVQARAIVASGLERGLGRDDISEELDKAAQATFINRAPSYWDVVAGAFTANTRSYAQMSSYAEAGVDRYQILAVLDEVTTPVCRFLDGKIFSVGSALNRFERIERAEAPEDIKQISPWVREGRSEDGRDVLYVNGTSGRQTIAEIERSGVGTRDDRGEFSAAATEKDLDTMGLGFPPYHGNCRTTTLAVV